MAFKTLNLARIAHRRLRRKTPPRSGAGASRARAANRFAIGCNLAGVAAVTMLIATLFAQAVTGDCTVARLAEAALSDAGALYEPFTIGLLFGYAPGTLAGIADFAGRWAATTDAAKRATAEHRTAAAWLRDEPILIALAAALALAMFAYGVDAAMLHIREQARWAHNASRHTEAVSACLTTSQHDH